MACGQASWGNLHMLKIHNMVRMRDSEKHGCEEVPLTAYPGLPQNPVFREPLQ